jgi:hypothetical protein
MKLSQLKNIVKEAVKEAIQEEMKDILMEAVRSSKQTVYENKLGTTTTNTVTPTQMSKDSRMAMRENIQNVLSGMMPGTDGTLSATSADVPLQVGSGDTTSPNGSLPQGNVSMDQIMGLMNSKG